MAEKTPMNLIWIMPAKEFSKHESFTLFIFNYQPVSIWTFFPIN
ncbi:hypothetical protein MGWOODY_Mmi1568 [hydrothermal vent metagenome]|uniref:Uncharacterized protein n=1 Tax=hydrothermal vent metagenome TaxID=652676 RepID=A0A160VFK1_9ZZZZ